MYTERVSSVFYFMRGVIVVVYQLSDIKYKRQICLKYVKRIKEFEKILSKNEKPEKRSLSRLGSQRKCA